MNERKTAGKGKKVNEAVVMTTMRAVMLLDGFGWINGCGKSGNSCGARWLEPGHGHGHGLLNRRAQRKSIQLMFWIKTFKFHWRTSGQRMSCAPAETLRVPPIYTPFSIPNDAASIWPTRAKDSQRLITNGTVLE